jgi:hypothetical protein
MDSNPAFSPPSAYEEVYTLNYQQWNIETKSISTHTSTNSRSQVRYTLEHANISPSETK